MKNVTTANAKNTPITLTSTEFISKYPKAFYDICKRIVLHHVLYLDSLQTVSNKFADALKTGFDDAGILNDLVQTTAFTLIERADYWYAEQVTTDRKAAAAAATLNTVNRYISRLQAENIINSSERTLNQITAMNSIKQELNNYEFEFVLIFNDYNVAAATLNKALKKFNITRSTFENMSEKEKENFIAQNCRPTSATRRKINAEMLKAFRQTEKTTTSEAEEAEKSVTAWNSELAEAENKMLLAPIMEQLEKVFNAYQLALLRASLNGVRVNELSARLGLPKKKIEYDLRKIFRYLERYFG